MESYLRAQNKMNDGIIKKVFSADEIERFSKSDFCWADNRCRRTLSKRNVTKGNIYQFDFGKNYIPEMSYEHRGLVVGVKKKLLYVLPIFSYKSDKHTDVYHPVEFPNSKSDLYLLKNSEFPFIKHDSVLKLNDLRTVSINRILYQQPGRIDPASETYKVIILLVLKKYFPDFYYDFQMRGRNLDSASDRIKDLEEENVKLKQEIVNLNASKEQNGDSFLN